MAKTYTPRYRIEYRDQDGWHIAAWPRSLGKPTNAKVERWRVDINASFQPKGINAHFRIKGDIVPHISHVHVVFASTGETRASAVMPSFEVV